MKLFVSVRTYVLYNIYKNQQHRPKTVVLSASCMMWYIVKSQLDVMAHRLCIYFISRASLYVYTSPRYFGAPRFLGVPRYIVSSPA